jgi:hypothetical protein
MRKQENRCSVPATNPGPKPADFPLRGLESRAAARMLAKTRAEQDAREPLIYRARFDEHGQPLDPVVIYDYNTGLPITEEGVDKLPQSQQQDQTSEPVPLAAPGESIDDPPTPQKSQAQARVITIEVG